VQFALTVPFGQDRLIPIWVATLAVKQQSRIVRFESAAQMLEFLQLPKDGLHYRRLVQGFQRIFAASIFFGSEGTQTPSQVFEWSRFHFFDRIELWFNRGDADSSSDDQGHENTITLSQSFYDEINQHRIPVERQVVASLANAPGLLDFYIWIVWKSWTVKNGIARIPLFGAHGLQGQLGAAHYSRNKRFRQTLRRWLRRIKVWARLRARGLPEACRYLVWCFLSRQRSSSQIRGLFVQNGDAHQSTTTPAEMC
jgi:hypothetical protein